MVKTTLIGVILAAATFSPALLGDEGGNRPIDLRSVDELRETELRWKEGNRVVRVGLDPDWPPFSSVNAQGELEGFDVDLLNYLSQETGIKFKLVTAKDWQTIFQQAQNGQIDMLASTAFSERRARDFRFTLPYYYSPVVIVAHRDTSGRLTLQDLSDHPIAMAHEHVLTHALEKRYPDLELTLHPSMQKTHQAVSRKEAFATLTSLPNAVAVIAGNNLTELRLAGMTPLQFELRFAVREDWPELVQILDHALANMPIHEKETLFGKWLNEGYEEQIAWLRVKSLLLVAGSVVAGIFLVLLMWNLLLRRANQQNHMLLEEMGKVRDDQARLNREQQHFFSMVAHDLKNPLTAVALNADLLRMKTAHHEDGVPRMAEEIGAVSRRMQRLVQKVLDYQKLVEREKKLTLLPIDLRHSCEQAGTMLTPMAQNKRSSLKLNLPEVACLARVDQDSMAQVLENLISNAIKFSPPESRIEVNLDQEGAQNLLRILDEGPGIAEDEREHLFERYARLSNRPTAHESTSGLGLSIVGELVAQMGGDIQCENRAGGGACFLVRLPIVKLEALTHS